MTKISQHQDWKQPGHFHERILTTNLEWSCFSQSFLLDFSKKTTCTEDISVPICSWVTAESSLHSGILGQRCWNEKTLQPKQMDINFSLSPWEQGEGGCCVQTLLEMTLWEKSVQSGSCCAWGIGINPSGSHRWGLDLLTKTPGVELALWHAGFSHSPLWNADFIDFNSRSGVWGGNSLFLVVGNSCWVGNISVCHWGLRGSLEFLQSLVPWKQKPFPSEMVGKKKEEYWCCRAQVQVGTKPLIFSCFSCNSYPDHWWKVIAVGSYSQSINPDLRWILYQPSATTNCLNRDRIFILLRIKISCLSFCIPFFPLAFPFVFSSSWSSLIIPVVLFSQDWGVFFWSCKSN